MRRRERLGGVTASDALIVLNRAVGLPATVTCECEATGETLVSQTVRTGQSTCFDVAGATISCAGTGQDGEFQAGSVRSFTDNLDGTVTDNATGLMWEKHGDESDIHDAENTYTWIDAVGVKIPDAQLDELCRTQRLATAESLRARHVDGPRHHEPGNVLGVQQRLHHQLCSRGLQLHAQLHLLDVDELPRYPAYAWSVNFSGGDTVRAEQDRAGTRSRRTNAP